MFPLKHIWQSKLELIQHMLDKDKTAPSVDHLHFPIQSSHVRFLPVFLMEKVTLCVSVRAVSHLLMFCLRRSHSLLITSHFNICSVLFAFPTKQQASFYVKHCLTSPPISYEKHTLTFGGLHQRPHWSKTLTLRWNSEWAPATTVTKVYALCLFLDLCLRKYTWVCEGVRATSLCACVFGLITTHSTHKHKLRLLIAAVAGARGTRNQGRVARFQLVKRHVTYDFVFPHTGLFSSV